ncbi:MAG: purine-nucleoside phosphorylase [Eubacterium sp.]|nr:purine-nucleoside phosphorylase [Eubacterium sp.]
MLEKQIEYIKSITDFKPEILIVLGSGLSALGDEIENARIIDYKDIPDFPVSTAPSHIGRFVFGMLGGKKVAVMQGRVHLYEGYTPQEVVMPLRLIRLLGANKLILTNAAGAINNTYNVGELMAICDHISLFVESALMGKNEDTLGVRFPDMSEIYSKRLTNILHETADEIGVKLNDGVYVQLNGPQFESPAEIRMLAKLGADAVGMSTVIEAQAARHCGFEVCAISVLSNMACGISDKPITSEEVNEAGKKTAPLFKELIKKSIGKF